MTFDILALTTIFFGAFFGSFAAGLCVAYFAKENA